MSTREDEILRRLAQGDLSPLRRGEPRAGSPASGSPAPLSPFDVAAYPELGMLRDTPPEPRATIGPQQSPGIGGLLRYRGPLNVARLAQERAEREYTPSPAAERIRQAAAGFVGDDVGGFNPSSREGLAYGLLGIDPSERPFTPVEISDIGDAMALGDASNHFRRGQVGAGLFDAGTAAIGALLPYGSLRGPLRMADNVSEGRGILDVPIGGRWHSRTLQAIEQSPQERMTAAQWRRQIEKNVDPETGRQRGTSAAERRITGIEEYLDLWPDDRVLTRTELLDNYSYPDMLESSRLGRQSPNPYEYVEGLQEQQLRIFGNRNLFPVMETPQAIRRTVRGLLDDTKRAPWDGEVQSILDEIDPEASDLELREQLAQAADDLHELAFPAERWSPDRVDLFSTLGRDPEDPDAARALVDIQNQRRLMDNIGQSTEMAEDLRMFESWFGKPIEEVTPEELERLAGLNRDTYSQFIARSGDLGLPQNQRTHIIRYRGRGQVEKPGHYGIPDQVVHVRLSERYDADGNRVLFVDEIQSDSMQNLGDPEPDIVRAEMEKLIGEEETMRMFRAYGADGVAAELRRKNPQRWAELVEQARYPARRELTAEGEAMMRSANERYHRAITDLYADGSELFSRMRTPDSAIWQNMAIEDEAARRLLGPGESRIPLDHQVPSARLIRQTIEDPVEANAAVRHMEMAAAIVMGGALPRGASIDRVLRQIPYYIRNEPQLVDDVVEQARRRLDRGKGIPSRFRLAGYTEADVRAGIAELESRAYRAIEADELRYRSRQEIKEKYSNTRVQEPHPYENTDDWLRLGVRRAVQDALAHNQDTIVFTTGAQSIEAVGTQAPQGMYTFYDDRFVKKALEQVRKELGLPKSAVTRVRMPATEPPTLGDLLARATHRTNILPTRTNWEGARMTRLADEARIHDGSATPPAEWTIESQEDIEDALWWIRTRGQEMISRERASSLLDDADETARRDSAYLDRIVRQFEETANRLLDQRENGQWALDVSSLRGEGLGETRNFDAGLPLLGVAGVGILGRQSFMEAVREREGQGGG